MERQDEAQKQLRSLRDFLLVYNRMTELCFQRCVASLNYRALTGEEEACLDGCAGKLVHSNHRLMATYVQLMPSIVQRRISDYEAAASQASDPGLPGPGAIPASPPSLQMATGPLGTPDAVRQAGSQPG